MKLQKNTPNRTFMTVLESSFEIQNKKVVIKCKTLMEVR